MTDPILVVYKGGDWLSSFKNSSHQLRSVRESARAHTLVRLTLSLLPPPYIRTHTSYSYYPLSILPIHPLTHSFILPPELLRRSLLPVYSLTHSFPYYPLTLIVCCAVLFVSSVVSISSISSVLFVSVCLVCLARLAYITPLAVYPFELFELFECLEYSSCSCCSSCSSCSAPPITPLPLSNSLNSIFITHQLI